MLSAAVMIQVSKLQYEQFNNENADSMLKSQEESIDNIDRCNRVMTEAIKTEQQIDDAKVKEEHQNENGTHLHHLPRQFAPPENQAP
jgi:hypothetical protein